MGSNDLPFIFNESTNDYQTVTIQGQISYKIADPKTLADVLDFTVTDNGQYKKNDIEKLNQRIINEAQTETPDTELFKTQLKAHQQGRTDFLTCIKMCATTGIEQ